MASILRLSLGSRWRYLLAAGLLPLSALLSNPVLAAPPHWAPAYGRQGHHHHPPPRHYARHHDDRHHHDRYRRHDILPWLGGVAVAGYLVGNRCNREAVGSVLGGVLGGLAGSNVGRGDGRRAASIAGALIGILVGRSIGRHMDRADQYCTGQTLEYARDRQSIHWYNPDEGTSYEVTPLNHYRSREGRYCREYATQAIIGGRSQQTFGTACRQPDGSWQIVN
ncbi:MAG: RT0821/Lpp0805 family surface protein [Gammaproteobacteria bacterium]|nr:RT0821/Lpp0805 family surface protein [Gammaproteobacteria bacterium]